MLVAGGLAGCSVATSSASSSGYTGQKALIATRINTLGADASSTNGSDICANVLAPALTKRLNELGDCATILNKQIDTVDDETLDIESITVDGSSASAQVKSVYDGNKRVETLKLVHVHAGWRIASIG
jgi:hypothetical protein